MPSEEHHKEALRRIREAEDIRAVALSLRHLDKLPPELERLPWLQQLDLTGCGQIIDISPLGNLPCLQQVNLSGCHQLSDLNPLAALAGLKQLSLAGCRQISDLTPLTSLTSLHDLDLTGCGQLGQFSPVGKLTGLQQLNLAGCRQLSDLSPLASLSSLQQLTISWCKQIRDCSPLAKLTSLQQLRFSNSSQVGDLSPLASLISLRSLDLSNSEQVSDLSPLASLRLLQRLDLSWCKQIRDFAPLANLISLQTLFLERCVGVRQFRPLKVLLATLQELTLFNCEFDDLPIAVCGDSPGQNVIDKVRAHYDALECGARPDAELKVFFLGNGGVGKTQLCRRLRGLDYDPRLPTTHGIQVSDMTVLLEEFSEPVRLNLWDFGGQELYYGTHALFLQRHAIFLVLWTPELERGGGYQEGGLTLRHRPLSYWLAYLRTCVGTESSVIIVQSQCDKSNKRVLRPPGSIDDFPHLWQVAVSASTTLGLDLVRATLKEAVRDCIDRRPPPPIGEGRVAVRKRLRQMLAEDQKRKPGQQKHRLLERAEFDRLCGEVGGVTGKEALEALIDFLYHDGVIFYRPGLFGDRIVLDQNWALKAIYAIFHRKKCFEELRRRNGRFTRQLLEKLIWWDGRANQPKYPPDEQKVFLGIVESCGICFRSRELSSGEWEYVAPELLPEAPEAQKLLLDQLSDNPPDVEVECRYSFLHDGILRGFLSQIGKHAGDAPIYWRYGCWFYEQTTRSQVLIESRWGESVNESGAGLIRFRTWGDSAKRLVELLLKTLRSSAMCEPSGTVWILGEASSLPDRAAGGDETPGIGTLEQLKQLEIPAELRPLIEAIADGLAANSVDLQKISSLLRKVTKRSGATLNLRGLVLEMIVAHLYRLDGYAIKLRQKVSEKGNQVAEIDVLAKKEYEWIGCECKGKSPGVLVGADEIRDWMEKPLRHIKEYFKCFAPEKRRLEFYVSTDYTPEARDMIAKIEQSHKKHPIQFIAGENLVMKLRDRKETALVSAFLEHFR